MPPEPPQDAHDEAMLELLARPDVVRVELGLREVAGRPVAQWAYRVFVRRKRPLDELSPSERLPTTVRGAAVDVLVGAGDAPIPLSCTKSVELGDRIERELSNQESEFGTVCALVRQGATHSILTCHHVIHPDRRVTGADAAFDVYVPAKRSCNKPAGRVEPMLGLEAAAHPVNGREYRIDATLVRMNAGIGGANKHSDIGGDLSTTLNDLSPLADPADMTAPAPAITVRMRGAKSGMTTGTVVGYRATAQVGGVDVIVRELIIKPAPGAKFEIDVEFVPGDVEDLDWLKSHYGSGASVTLTELGAAPDGRLKLRFAGHTFSLPGDSGAPIIDGDRKLVGMLAAGEALKLSTWTGGHPSVTVVPKGNGHGYAVFIVPTFSVLGLDPATGILPVGVPAAGAPVVVPDEPWLVGPEVFDDALLNGTADRDRLRALATEHAPAVIDLIHERRRVMLIWHREKGAAFMAAIVAAFRTPGTSVPAEIDGVRIGDSLCALRAVLHAEGGPALRDALDAHGDWLLRIAERCVAATDLRAAVLEATA